MFRSRNPHPSLRKSDREQLYSGSGSITSVHLSHRLLARWFVNQGAPHRALQPLQHHFRGGGTPGTAGGTGPKVKIARIYRPWDGGTGLYPQAPPHRFASQDETKIKATLKTTVLLVGATGVEPARIAPKDPKSFASANSATRPI